MGQRRTLNKLNIMFLKEVKYESITETIYFKRHRIV